ncbi:hypothetical protein LINPERHAP1_LOCUS16948 [Linum perenne]
MEGKLIMKRVWLSALIVVLLVVAASAKKDKAETPSSSEKEQKETPSSAKKEKAKDKSKDDSKLGGDKFGSATLDDITSPENFASGPSPTASPTSAGKAATAG